MASPVALITAGSAGLGAATAKAFAAMGLRVAINYSSNESRANSLVSELESTSSTAFGQWANGRVETGNGKRFIAIRADVSSRPEVDKLISTTIQELGRLDIVFSNHGWTKLTNFSNLSENVNEEDWDKCWNMNVKSHLWLFNSAKGHLEQSPMRGGGCFITTSSVAGVGVMGSSLAYAVTKSAQIHLAKCLASISGASNIRVNSVSPGMMMTEWSSSFPESKRNAAIKKTKLGRLTEVEDVAEQVCSFVRNSSITGANAVIDCGSIL
ncbi:short chain dehydrogenase [Trichoderma gamsii]|uniref:Short chain dehydrogenase n=1 Tax=Trichoderma gamsii TaxID=398673 RepID=A0A2P4ZJX0_9HYPO|nr:short chain dehydrogenase [Trichoderma gamsii]PON24578.1 short chain dehydrogenase [Trichoderma gamsii]